jgi:hypothetical protein
MNEHQTQKESELLDFLHAIDERAPTRLHERVGALTAGAGSKRRGRITSAPTLRLGLAAASLLAGIAAVVIALSGSSSSVPSVRAETALTLRGATLGAPPESASSTSQLRADVEGVAFPYWDERFGWQATGARTDDLHGRTVQTVFYSSPSGQRVGYAIVAGTPAPKAGGGVVRWRQGTAYRMLDEHGVAVVTWLRNGRRCVVSGRGVSTATLLRLASWDDARSAS